MSRKALLAAALTLVVGSPMAWAQDRGAPGQEGIHEPGGPGGMAEKLDLTADQQAKLKAIGAAHQAEAKPLHEQAKERIKELKALVASKAGDAAITAKLAELKTVREAMQALQKKFMEQREQVFTPEQRAQIALRRGEKMGDRKGDKAGMKGMKGMKCGKDTAPESKK